MDFGRKHELKQKREELEREIAALEAQEKVFSALPLDARVAEMMHSLHCHSNHTLERNPTPEEIFTTIEACQERYW